MPDVSPDCSKYYGSKKIVCIVKSCSIDEDGTFTKETVYIGECGEIDKKYCNLRGDIVLPEEREEGTCYITSLTWENPQQGKLKRISVTCKGFYTEICSGCGVGVYKETSASASVSLQEVALIEHPRYRWILTHNESEKFEWCDARDGCVKYCAPSLIKAIQMYVSVADDPEKAGYAIGLKNKLDETTGGCGCYTNIPALEYANEILVGHTNYWLPQATFSVTKTFRGATTIKSQCSSDVGFISSLPKPFEEFNCSWSVLKNGTDIQYSFQNKKGTIATTWIGIPKSNSGGGWDSRLYTLSSEGGCGSSC